MSWSEWQPVKGRRARRRLRPQSPNADEDDVQLPEEETESGPGRPQAREKAKLYKSWLERTREFFKNPPEWKIKVENTFISVHGWHDRTLRTTLSAPACLMTASSSGARVPAPGSPDLTSPSNVSTREEQHHERAEVSAPMPKLTNRRLPSNFPSVPSSNPPAPPLTMDEAEDSPSSSSKFTETNEVRAADEAAGPKRRKPKTKCQCKTTTEAPPLMPHAVSTPPVARPRPAPAMNDFGMTTVVRGRRRKGHRIQVLRNLDDERGTSVEADDEDASSMGQTSSTPCHTKSIDDILVTLPDKRDASRDSERLSASSTQKDFRDDDEESLHRDVEEKDIAKEETGESNRPKDSANTVVEVTSPSLGLLNSHSVSTTVSSPTGKTARRQRKRAAKAAAKANLVTTTQATPPRNDCRYDVAAQCRSGRDFYMESRGLAHYSWPSSRPCAGRAGALQRRQAQFLSVEAEVQAKLVVAADSSADAQLKEMRASVSSDDESEIFTLESEDDFEESPRQRQQQENGAALPPASEAKAAQAFFVNRGGSFPTCTFVAAGDAAAGNGLRIDQFGKASLSADSGNIGRVIAALVREKGLAGMPSRDRGLSAN